MERTAIIFTAHAIDKKIVACAVEEYKLVAVCKNECCVTVESASGEHLEFSNDEKPDVFVHVFANELQVAIIRKAPNVTRACLAIISALGNPLDCHR